MTLRQKKQVYKIIKVLSGQRFWDFYAKIDGPFDYYLGNKIDNPKLQKETEEKIKELFNIK
jgi:hypothetical protein